MLFRYLPWVLTLTTVAIAAPVTRLQKRDVPDFVRTYAPVAYLQSKEVYFPSSIAGQLTNTHPEDDTGATITPPSALTLDNLDSLNSFANGGTDVFLTSNEGIQALPAWFQGTKPSSGTTGSTIASAIITVSKPGNIVDAFYFYFYAYNQGNWVLGSPLLEFGDHVGDWEHTMVRFVNGVPQAVWFSQHSGGQAFTYAVTEKYNGGVRPVVYVAQGTHANYAKSGDHDHTIRGLNLPGGPLEDHTDAGTLWDPIANAYTYSFDTTANTFTAYKGQDPTGWLAFTGRWGDNELPTSTPGQVDVFGQKKYVAGPTGPADKDLARANVCPGDDTCDIKTRLVARDEDLSV